MIKSTRFLKKTMLGENINKDIVLVLDKTFLLFQKLKENYNNSDLKKNNLFRGLNSLAKNDTSKALEIINLIGDTYDDISYLAIKIKVFSAEKLIDNALEVIEQITENKRKKRMYMPIYESLCVNDKDTAFNFMKTNIYKKFRLFESELECLYDYINSDNINIFMKIMSDNDIVIQKDTELSEKLKEIGYNTKIVQIGTNHKCPNCSNAVIKIPFNDNSRKQLITNLEKVYLNGKIIVMDELEKRIHKKKYDAFIDGNNVLFYIDRAITLNSFIRLKSIYEEISKTHKPLITLHRRHNDFLNKNLKGSDFTKAMKILNSLKESIFYTPYKMNDDWFFIWAGITIKNSLVVTNDLLRDHINKISEENIISNTLLRWISDHVIRYDFPNSRNSKDSMLTYPDDISFKIQQNNSVWHLPINKGRWICQGS
jgi:hypothetical protein